MSDITTVFAGSPEFAATILASLADSRFAPIAVYTQPDRAQGRGRKVKPNAVKRLAGELKLPVLQPSTLRSAHAVEALAALQPDVLIVAAYGLILPPEILAIPTYGCINVHASLLPRWRGAAPIERAIMAGDAETGVCIMKMEAGLDTGPVYVSTHTPIVPSKSAIQLEEELAEQGAKDLIAVLGAINKAHRGKRDWPVPTTQDESKATYADKLTSLDRTINWAKPATEIARQINALAGRLPVRLVINDCGVQLLAAQAIEQTYPADDQLAAGTLIDGSKTGLLVQCATDILQITSLKVERGKGKALDPAAALNGFSDLFHPGARLI